MARTRRLPAQLLGVLATAALLLAFVGSAQAAGAANPEARLNQPVAASLITSLQQASKAGLGLAVVPEPYLKAIDGPRLDTGTGDKVGLLYLGADFCPYCAGQRWALVLTLLRFGSFDGLEYMLSSPRDAYPNTATFSFQHSSYHSKYVAFQPVETSDRNGKKLMEPTKQQKTLYATYDAPPYTQVFGAIPFLYLDGQYILSQPMLLPGAIAGKYWEAVAKALADPTSKVFQDTMPQVNALTAAICRLDGGNPDAVCSAPGVTAANGALLRLPAPGS